MTQQLPAAILWDMDGTLVDTEPYWLTAEREMVHSFGGTWTHEDGLALVGSGLWTTAEIFQGRGVALSADEIVDHLTDRVLEQMGRVASRQIVSLPNFGHWKLRTGLAFTGRMPVSPLLPYQWFDTPNIQRGTLADFENTLGRLGIQIRDRVLLDSAGRRAGEFTGRRANLLAEGAVYSLCT